MRNFILDMGGVIYSFSNDFDASKHEKMFIQGLQEVNYIFEGIIDEYNDKGATNKVLEAEYYLVKNNLLKIYPIQSSIERINTEFKLENLFIVSTSLEVTSEYICNFVGLKNIPKLIFNASNYGSKKEKDTWKAIFTTIGNIDVVVEDSEKNLLAAQVASNELGISPKCVKSILEI